MKDCLQTMKAVMDSWTIISKKSRIYIEHVRSCIKNHCAVWNVPLSALKEPSIVEQGAIKMSRYAHIDSTFVQLTPLPASRYLWYTN
jgi:hypothetical protein